MMFGFTENHDDSPRTANPMKEAPVASTTEPKTRFQENLERAATASDEAASIDLRAVPKAQRDLARQVKEATSALVSALADYERTSR